MSDMRGHARKALAALRQFVETQVLEGHWPPGTQLPTERELADQFAISRNTVRRQMLQLVKDGWIDRHVDGGTGIMLDDALAGVYAALLTVLTGWPVAWIAGLFG